MDETIRHGGAAPCNLEVEQAFLAALLTNNLIHESVSDFLVPEHFADPAHRLIFTACKRLIEEGHLANAVTLKNHLEAAEALLEVGGVDYLAKLAGAVVSTINASDYARTILDLYLRRQVIALAAEAASAAANFDLELPAERQIQKIEEQLYRLAEQSQRESEPAPIEQSLARALAQAERALGRAGGLAGVTTGLVALDNLLGGLQASDLIILAGRPSMGKTALATTIGLAAAKRPAAAGGAVVGLFSLEMSAEQISARVLSEECGIASDRIRRGQISKDELNQLYDGKRTLAELALFIDDTPSITLPQLRSRARRLKRRETLGLLIVDYLQLMRPGRDGTARAENRVQEISEISRGLKALAKELDIPVLALSQLSRAVEQRDDKRPQLADLRESGSIEQDADIVLFVFREHYYLERSEPLRKAGESEAHYAERHHQWHQLCEAKQGYAEVIVGKQRHGPIGQVSLRFDGATAHFSDLAAGAGSKAPARPEARV